MFRFVGLFALIPTMVLLTISYFVLVVNKRFEGQGLAKFGAVIAVLLWIVAAIIFSTGIFFAACGGHCAGKMGWMGHRMGAMQGQSCCPAMPPAQNTPAPENPSAPK